MVYFGPSFYLYMFAGRRGLLLTHMRVTRACALFFTPC